jgi:DNA-binding NarL/FixJ family response regulator
VTASTQQPRWRVVIADDEPPAVTTLRLLLSRHPTFNVVAECGHGQQAIDAVCGVSAAAGSARAAAANEASCRSWRRVVLVMRGL